MVVSVTNINFGRFNIRWLLKAIFSCYDYTSCDLLNKIFKLQHNLNLITIDSTAKRTDLLGN